MKQSSLAQLRRQLALVSSVALTTHKFPDDDAIGSMLGLYHLLKPKKNLKKIGMILESPIQSRWKALSGYRLIQTTSNLPSELRSYQMLIALDGNQYSRFTTNTQGLEEYEGTKVCIDHHASQADSWDLAYIYPKAVATAQVVSDMFYRIKDRKAAKHLLMGLIGDTNSFKTIGPKQAQVFRLIEKLTRHSGVSHQSLMAQYNHYGPGEIEVVKSLMSKMCVWSEADWPPLQVSFITKQDTGDLPLEMVKEGISLYQTSFNMIQEGIGWSVVFYPGEDGSKLSLRSSPGSVNVRQLLEKLEIGGGHDLAAGGYYPDIEVHEAMDRFRGFLQTGGRVGVSK